MDIVMVWYQHDWGLFDRRYEMIARTWVKTRPGDRVLVVEPPVNLWVWARELGWSLRQRDWVMWRYWLAKGAAFFSPLKKAGEGLWVLRPFYPWVFRATGPSAAREAAFRRAWGRVCRFLRREGWARPVLWVYPPHRFVRYAVERWTGPVVCADIVDDNTHAAGMPEAVIREYRETYDRVLDRASVAFSVSPALSDRFSRSGKPVVHVPNAVSADRREEAPFPVPLPAGPRACYVGHIDGRMDVEVLSHAARALPHVQFIFVGPVAPSIAKVWRRAFRPLRNVHLWRTIPGRSFPALIREMDVCLLPHRESSLTASMDPLKLYRYLAARKPVVATGVRIDPGLAPWVLAARGAAEFTAALRRALSSPRRSGWPDMASHSWEARVASMASRLDVLT